jgi:hypothetical protein
MRRCWSRLCRTAAGGCPVGVRLTDTQRRDPTPVHQLDRQAHRRLTDLLAWSRWRHYHQHRARQPLPPPTSSANVITIYGWSTMVGAERTQPRPSGDQSASRRRFAAWCVRPMHFSDIGRVFLMNCPTCAEPMISGWIAMWNPIIGQKVRWQPNKPGYRRLRVPKGATVVLKARPLRNYHNSSRSQL